MYRMHLVPQGTNINFVKNSKYCILGAIIAIIVCFSCLFFKGLNYGLDFKGGYIFEVQMAKESDIAKMRIELSKLGLGEASIQQFGSNKDLLIKLEKSQEGKQQAIDVQKVKNYLGKDVIYKRIETVGPKVGDELVSNAVKAVTWALIAMLAYIVIRLGWQFGICAVAALFHDCAIIFGIFSIFPLEFSETSITAVLLTASYSINDTVVIFDRIRENLKRYRNLKLQDIVNKSLNETLSRTILTATTTLLAVFALYIFGGKVIAALALPIMIGIIVGTFSSLFIAAPLLIQLKIQPGDKKARGTEVPTV